MLFNAYVDVCLTAPSNRKQLQENLAGLSKGPLSPDELSFLTRFGDLVHKRHQWFMQEACRRKDSDRPARSRNAYDLPSCVR